MSDSLQPYGLYSAWNSPGQNTGVGSLSLLQGIFPTQSFNPGFPLMAENILLLFSDFGQYWTSFLCICCSVAKLCLTLCESVDCSTPVFPVLYYLPEFIQTHTIRVGDAIQSSHPLSLPSPPALNLSQHQDLFQWINSLYQVAKALEFCRFSYLLLGKLLIYIICPLKNLIDLFS